MTDGFTIFDRTLQANTVSAFLQTDIKAAKNFHVVPGVRFEWYGVNRDSASSRRRGGRGLRSLKPGAPHAESTVSGALRSARSYRYPGVTRMSFKKTAASSKASIASRYSEQYDSFNVLPGISFAYNGFYRTTVFGGYHRGMSTGVLRNEDFPAPGRDRQQLPDRLRSSGHHWAWISRSPPSTSA